MAGEKGAIGKAGAHVIADAVERGGVREAERLAPKAAEEAATKSIGKTADDAVLTEADQAALRSYTGPAYRDINAYNRGAKVTPEQAAQLEKQSSDISTALGKLPSHDGTVYRGGKFDPDVVAKYEPGQIVTEDAFTSSSLKRGFKGNTQFEIISKDGKYIAPYAEPRFQHQEEVLFDRGTQFRVLTKDVRNGKTFIIMEEV